MKVFNELLKLHWLDDEDFEESIIKLQNLAKKQAGYVLAIDFDGVICKNEYPNIGKPNSHIIRMVQFAQTLGFITILYTCRENDEDNYLQQAVDFCKKHHLKFHAVNANAPERIAFYNHDSRKIGYDELWDDLSVNPTLL